MKQQDRVTELFDKYNLLALPVVDEEAQAGGRDHGGRHHFRAEAEIGVTRDNPEPVQARIYIVFLGGPRAGIYHRDGGQRCRRNSTYSQAGARWGYLPLWTLCRSPCC